MNAIPDFIESLGLTHPATYLVLFLAASLLTIWRLEAMMDQGLEGTALGTLVTPYCSGLGNLAFVFLLLKSKGSTGEVVINCLVNNVTNLTLLLGVPALLWGLEILPRTSGAEKKGGVSKRQKKNPAVDQEKRLSRLSLLLTMAAVIFFTGAVWALGQDGQLDFTDGIVLTGIFLFWQCFQVFDVLKHNVRQSVRFGPMLYVDLLVVIACAVLLYASLDWLVSRLYAQKTGFFSAKHIGWLSGWLMVLPNALLAFFYGARGRADVVYASQVGDGHICIPLCVGLCAMIKPVTLPALFETGVIALIGATIAHIVFIGIAGRLPRWAGLGFVGGYVGFLYAGFA